MHAEADVSIGERYGSYQEENTVKHIRDSHGRAHESLSRTGESPRIHAQRASQLAQI